MCFLEGTLTEPSLKITVLKRNILCKWFYVILYKWFKDRQFGRSLTRGQSTSNCDIKDFFQLLKMQRLLMIPCIFTSWCRSIILKRYLHSNITVYFLGTHCGHFTHFLLTCRTICLSYHSKLNCKSILWGMKQMILSKPL